MQTSDATPHPPSARTPTGDRHVLAIAGLTSAEEAAYELLVDRHTATLTHLATTWRRPEPLADTLAPLEANGLVTRSPGDPDTYHAVAPDAGLEDLLLSREQQLADASRYAGQLAASYAARATGRPPAELVEVVTGQRAVQRRLTQIQHAASEELCCLDKPPYLDQASTSAALECLDRGVRCRTIYERASVELPGSFPQIARLAEAGEQARVIANLPMKLYLADRHLALLPLQRQPAAVEAAVIVHPCGLLDALGKLFDSLWQRALPLNLSPSGAPPATRRRPRGGVDDERLIALLLSGLTDQAIAHQLGIGHRTVQRHVATLMDQLGAHTRFQAGVQAAIHHQRSTTR